MFGRKGAGKPAPNFTVCSTEQAFLNLLDPGQRATYDKELNEVKKEGKGVVDVPVRGNQGGQWFVRMYVSPVSGVYAVQLLNEHYSHSSGTSNRKGFYVRCMNACPAPEDKKVDAFAAAAAMLCRIEADERWVHHHAG